MEAHGVVVPHPLNSWQANVLHSTTINQQGTGKMGERYRGEIRKLSINNLVPGAASDER